MADLDGIRDRHRRVRISRTFRTARIVLDLGHRRVLDAGCGYGEYLGYFGTGSVGVTTTRGEVDYGAREGLAIVLGNVEEIETLTLDGTFDAVWANNLFEHLVAPHAFLISLKKIAPQGRLILGVPVIPFFSFLVRFRIFRGALATNHINFFTRKTLWLSVERAGWIVEAVRPFYFQNATLDRLFAWAAPHLYVVARNNPSFVYPQKKLKEWEGEHYRRLLDIAGPRA